MDVLFYAIELVCIAVGAGSAFIFDSFFTLSLKHHKIQLHEEKMLSQISLFAVISSAIGLMVYTLLLATKLEMGIIQTLDIALLKIILFSIALLTSLTLRKIHLPQLLRYQKQYFHLSLHFGRHQDSLVSTAVYSTVSWMSIIILTVIEEYKQIQFSSASILSIAILYICVSMLLSQTAIWFKNKHLS
jgi:hypothetical protein